MEHRHCSQILVNLRILQILLGKTPLGTFKANGPSGALCIQRRAHIEGSVVTAGPIGAVRVGKLQSSEWVVNPSLKQQKVAALNLLYAGTRDACTLLEFQVCGISYVSCIS